MRTKNYLLLLLFVVSANLFSQNYVPFTPRFDQDLRGDMLLIGNNILNRSSGGGVNAPYNGSNDNGSLDMQYIDIDGDASTFSSSSADLAITGSTCYKIKYAGLYWGALLQSGSRTDINKVKLKLPGGVYQNITGSVIYDANATPINGGKPYACYADITAAVTALATPTGTYTVANVLSSTGSNGGLGLSAGWSIFIVYEDPTLTAKSIVSFDGFSGIDGSTNLNIPVTGFRTIPTGPVRAKFAFTALEGDKPFTGDFLEINGTAMSTAQRPADNFFNSSITTTTGFFTTRNPNSSNTLGYDAGVIDVNNPLNGVIANNATSATIQLGTGGDVYYYFFNAFNTEVIAPKISLTKQVQNLAGVDIAFTGVTICQDLKYVVSFQNIGNDDATNVTIRDVLPNNVTFNPASLVLPAGVTVLSYNPVTREIIFTIANNLVNVGDPIQTITIPVKVVCTCLELDDACSNLIQNQAYATYQGVLSGTQITDDPSLSTFSVCNLSPPSPTNTLINLDLCNFAQDVVLCGTTVSLTAANGYESYVWTGPAPSTAVIGNTQTITVNQVGVYTVNDNINLSPCRSIVQTFNVVDITGTPPLTNPVLPYADQTVICPNDGKALPLIFLCGAADCQLISTTITGATSISWEQLNTASCAAVVNPNCANENPACTWTVVGTGANYNACTAGEFRVIVNYPGGCSRTFYFNVFKNLLNPTAIVTPIFCASVGSITVTGVPASGYEYQLNCTGAWQSNPVFSPLPAGIYSVCVRQTGVTGGCVFTIPNISITNFNTNYNVTATITQPLCFGGKGCINIAANNGLPQYTFSIYQGATLISTVGPTNTNNNLFCNLSPGSYTYTVTTSLGCTTTVPFTINNPSSIVATAAITKPLTFCADGEITVTAAGGTPPYNYIVTGAVTVTQGSPVIAAPVAGTYNIQVVDFNNCIVNTSVVVVKFEMPVFTVSQINVLCYGSNTGAINFNVTNANGWTLEYSADGGLNYQASPNFPNLIAGTYTIIIRCTITTATGTAVCTITPPAITITQPAFALTASAGVSELAGCGPLGEGKVRIINPQGGTPSYTYSFNNGSTYTGVNEAYLLPGTYTVYIKDFVGCIFPMTVTIDPTPAPPTIVVTPPVFACNGTSTSTVTVNNNGGSFAYTYLLDAVPNTPPSNNVFTNVPCGNHVVTVNYQATNIPTPSNLLFEDFGIGANTTTPGIAPAYCYHDLTLGLPSPCPPTNNPRLEDNQYVVTKAIIPNNGAWFPYRDHTSNGTNPNGRFLAVNIGSAAGPNGVLYSKTINNVLPNQPVFVDIYLANLLTVGNGGADPSFILELVDGAGTVIASQSTGIIDNTVNAWQLKSVTLNPGANTTLIFKVRSGSIIYGGNDAAIDDINVYQEPIACITTRNFPINIACNQAFTAQVTGSNNVSCNGGNNGSITIAAQNFAATGFQYSLNGPGGPWITSLVSPVTISGLTAATYNIQIRYDSNPANTACSFPFTTILTQPAVLVPTVTATPATCLVGSTITASAVGGTPAYQYQLQTSPGAAIVVAYQASGTFTNIAPGNYVVLVRDANLCTSTSIAISVVAATPPTAVIAATSNFCYTSGVGATLVVTASGGVAPYTYSIGGAYQAGNTFANLTPGSYTITVKDFYGCTVTLPAQTIAAQLTLNTVLTKDLDCTASPNAVITGTIAGGYPGYTYQVSINGGAFGAVVPVPAAPGNVFTYTTAAAGTYQFQVTDTRGCTAQSSVITINPLVNPTATTAVTNVTCNGLSNGSVVITPSLGVPPYVIQWNGAGAFTSTTTYSGLAAGTYTYIVRDAKSCLFNGSVTVIQPATLTGIATLTTPYTCTGNGVITVSGVSGGTPGYTYSISGLAGPFQAGTTFPIAGPGTYIVTIKDLSGCTFATASIIVTPNTPPTDLTFAATALTCPTNVSTVTLTATGGSPVLNYQIIAPAASATGYQVSNVFAGLAPGTYTFQVRDGRNCTYQESYTIAPLPVLTVTGSVVNNVRCFGTATGSATFTVGGSTGFTYTINGVPQGVGASPITLTNQLAGTYTIVVTNTATNCTATTSVTIAQPAAALAMTLTPSPVTCLINGQVVVNAVGGWGGNVYTIFPPAGTLSGNTFSNLPANTYTVTTTDAGGCAVTANFTLVAPTPPTATISAASNFCYTSPTGATIVVTPAGGVAPYTYTINGNPNASNTFSNLTPGSYTIVVTDSFGCAVTLPVQTIAPQLTLNTVLTKDLDCTASPNALFTGTIAGGYPGYTYQVRILPSAVFTNLGAVPAAPGNVFTYTAGAGSYQFQVTDTRGCTAQSGIFTVNPLIPVAATHVQTNNLCFGATAGSVTITPSGGVGPYQIQWNGVGAFTSTTTYSGLAAGTYTYIVRDSKSCIFNGSVTITQPALIAYAAVVNPIQCNALGGYTLGSICVNGLTGGVAPYTYTLVDLTGGNPNQVFVSPAGANHCFPNIDFGMYTITVTDANACTIVKSNLIMSNPPNDLTFVVSPMGGTCAAGSSVTVYLVGALGFGPFEFAIMNWPVFPFVNPIGNFVPASSPPFTHVFTGLTPGAIFTIVVRDTTTGCYYFEQMTAPTATSSVLNVAPLVANPVPCRGGNNGSVTFSLAGINAATTSINYSVHYASNNLPVGAATNGTILPAGFGLPVTVGPLAPGTYNIQFTEIGGAAISGCGVTSANFTITESATDLTLSATTTNDNCNANAGHIAPTAIGGTGPYTFQYLATGSPAPTAISPGWVAINPFNAESGTYDVYVKDAFGCIKMVTVVIGLDPTPVIAASVANACVTQGTYAINVTMPTAGVAPYTFSVDSGTFVSNTAPFTISGLSSGTHTIQVRDVNGCGNTVSVTILDPLIVSAVFTTQPTCFNSNGTVTATASGGSAPANYTYTLLSSASVVLAGPQASATFINQAAGCYIIRVTDSVTGCSANTPFCLDLPIPVTFTAVPTAVSCNGGSDGTITVNLAAGNTNPTYTYQITAGPVTTGVQSSNVFTGLTAGTYTIQVISGRGCQLIDNNVIVGTPTPVVASAVATPFTCAANNSVNVSVITVTGAGGTPAYTYSIDGINYFATNTFNITNTGAIQNFTAYVKDLKGCIGTIPLIVNPLPAITNATVVQTTAITCSNPELVTINVVGGSGTFTYQTIPAGAANVVHLGATNQFTISAPGTYFFQVNDVTTGCYFATLAYTVAPFNTFDAVATTTTAVACFGNGNGAISLNVTGYSGAYSYNVLDAANAVIASGVGNTTVLNPAPIVGLPAGNFTIQVTESASPFCTKISNVVTVASPTQVALALVSNINANCNSGAQVTVTGSGGTPGYTYAFVQNGFIPVLADYTASNTATLNPLTNTQWDVYVKDANGCFVFIDVTIATDPLPTVTVPAIATDQCTSTGATFTFTATGTGLAPLTYSIGTGFQASPVFTVAAPATYTVTIKDVNGCTATAPITIYPSIGVNPTLTALPTCADNDGVITVTTVGGSGTFNYAIVPSPAGVTLVGNVFSNLPAGTYTITVTDAITLCTKDVSVTLIAPTPVTFTTLTTNVTCSGGSDGTITVNLGAGNNDPVYTYQIIAGPVTTAVPQTSNVFTGLPTGIYTIQVNSGRNCSTADNTVAVGTPAPIVVPATTIAQFGCTAGTNAVNLATITVTGVTGGSGVYTNYEFILGGVVLQSGSSNTYSTANAAGGTYTINVFDDKGCIGTTTAIVNPYISITNPTVVVNNPVTCTTNEQITISATVSGGVPPVFTYTVTGYPTNAIPYNVTQNSPTFTGLTIGDYLITVLNPVTGCSVQTVHYVFDPNTFDLTINTIVDVTCFGGNNGSANITIIDNDVTPTNDAGSFNYTILDAASVVVASGVTANAGPVTISGLPAGIYTANVSLVATPFCTVSQNFTISGPTSALAVSATSSPITCVAGNNDGTITASATGGWGAPYEFQLQLGAAIVGTYSYSANANFTGLTAGTYTVYARDVKGCIVQTNVTLTIPAPISTVFTPSALSVACNGDHSVSISFPYPTGGQGSNYSYVFHSNNPSIIASGPIAIPNGAVTTISGLGADTYTIDIIDGFNCSLTSANIVITEPAIVNASLAINTTQTCLTQTTLTLTGSGGTMPYSYSPTGVAGSFIPFAPAASTTMTLSVPVGTHHYYIQDANGCISVVSGDVVIDPLTPLTLSAVTHTDILCTGFNTGTISATANGGLLSYVYTLLDAATLLPIAPAPTQLTPGNFTNLPAGTYVVHVASLDCGKDSDPVVIDEPAAAFTVVATPNSANCFGGTDGFINLVMAGGTGSIQYAISPNLGQFFTITDPYNVNGFNIPNLSGGVTYTITVQDQNGCVPYTFTFSIGQPAAPLVSNIASHVDEACAEQDLGEILVTGIGGGTAPYTINYSVVYPGTTTSVVGTPVVLGAGVTSYNFTGLNGGDYTITVTDAHNCKSDNQVIVGSGVTYAPIVEVTYPCVANAPAVRVEVLNASNAPSFAFTPMSDYLFSLDVNSSVGAQSSNIFTSATSPSLLTPGPHTIYVFHVNGCDKAALPNPFTISATDIDPLTLTLTQGGLNTILATSTGGSGGNTYTFNGFNNGNSNTYVYDHTGDYTVTVTDSSGCSKTLTKPFVFVPIKIDNVFTPDGDGNNDGWGPKNTSNYKNLVTKIYDRYGREVAELKEGEVWYGKYNGQELPSGDYWYVIKVDAGNDEEYVGHFTLYR